jgi:glycosyltransferase involved in cell wall biosynthesis
MRILQVSPFTAYPPTGGGQSRVHGLLAGRDDGDTAIRLAVADLDEASDTVQIDRNYLEERVGSYCNSLVGLVTEWIGLGQVYADLGLRLTKPSRLRDLVDWADLILIEFPWYVSYITQLADPETPVVYSSHNFEPDFYARLFKRITTAPAARRVQQAEDTAVKMADLVVTTTEDDADQYRSVFDTDTPFYVAPNGVPAGAVNNTRLDGSSPPYTAIFVGSKQPHNVAAAKRVLAAARDEQIRRQDLQFRIIGSVCDSLDSSKCGENVVLSGFVDDLTSVYADADFGLNPVFDGGGSNVKLPEYLGHGLATVTTQFGARGYPIKPGTHCVIDESLVDGLLSLLDDGSPEIEKVASRGHQLASERLTWERISGDLFTRFRELCP